jgi:hypothetical protein
MQRMDHDKLNKLIDLYFEAIIKTNKTQNELSVETEV